MRELNVAQALKIDGDMYAWNMARASCVVPLGNLVGKKELRLISCAVQPFPLDYYDKQLILIEKRRSLGRCCEPRPCLNVNTVGLTILPLTSCAGAGLTENCSTAKHVSLRGWLRIGHSVSRNLTSCSCLLRTNHRHSLGGPAISWPLSKPASLSSHSQPDFQNASVAVWLFLGSLHCPHSPQQFLNATDTKVNGNSACIHC